MDLILPQNSLYPLACDMADSHGDSTQAGDGGEGVSVGGGGGGRGGEWLYEAEQSLVVPLIKVQDFQCTDDYQ